MPDPTTTALIAQSNPTRIADIPANVPETTGFEEGRRAAESVGKSLYESPRYTGAVASKNEMLNELFNYDQQLEGMYAGRGATTEAARAMYGPEYVSHPGDIIGGAAAYGRGLGQNVGTAQSALRETSGEYEKAMTNVMSKFLDFYKLREERRQAELDRDERETNRIIDILAATGGDWTDPKTGVTHHFMSPTEKAALEARYRAPREKSWTERLYEQQEPKRREIAGWFATQSGSRAEAEEEAKAMIGRGYDTELVYEELDKLFPEEDVKDLNFGYSQWEVEAGVAGQPKSPVNVSKAERYLKTRPTGTLRTLGLTLGEGTEAASSGEIQSGTTGAVGTPTQAEIVAAQDAINKSGDRQGTYNAIIADFPYLQGYISP